MDGFSLFDILPPTQAMLVLAIALIILLLLRRQIARVRRPAIPRVEQLKQSMHLDAKKLASEIEVRLHDSFREMAGRLETKTLVLNELLDLVDKRISELKKLTSDSALPGSAEPPANAPSEEPLVVDPDRTQGQQPPKVAPVSVPNRFDDVYACADNGMSLVEISKETGKTIGEIEVILSMRRIARDARPTSVKE